MRNVLGMSLKARLAAGFFICAALTGFSGGIGIYSLRQIMTVTSSVKEDVGQRLETQTADIRRMLPMITLVDDIIASQQIDDLAGYRSRLKSFTSGEDGTEIKGIEASIWELIDHKKERLDALGELDAIAVRNQDLISKISDMTVESVDITEQEASQAVERAIKVVRAGLSKAFQERASADDDSVSRMSLMEAAGIDDLSDEMVMTSEMSISAVRAALSVQSKANRQLHLIKLMADAEDEATIRAVEKELMFLLGRMNSELVELPEHPTTERITLGLQEFRSLADQMLAAKLKELEATRKMQEESAIISEQMLEQEERLISSSGALRSSVNMSMESARSRITRWQAVQAGLVAAALILAGLIGVISVVAIFKPVKNAVAMLKNIAMGEGDLTMRLDDSGKDEMSIMGRWFNRFVEKIHLIIQQLSGDADRLKEASAQLSDLSGSMTGRALEMKDDAREASLRSEAMGREMTTIASAMAQASDNITMVSSASEQMTATIQEIARTTSTVQAVSSQAVGQAQQASANMDSLQSLIDGIGEISDVIHGISSQINLLALNATIESARAGEAGKGFAVVAGEIKELAMQTSHATKKIAETIEEVRSSTRLTVTEIQEIMTIIGQINENVISVASSMEEQSVTTGEISRSIVQMSDGVSKVNEKTGDLSRLFQENLQTMQNISRASDGISGDCEQMDSRTNDLSEISGRLNDQVLQFRV